MPNKDKSRPNKSGQGRLCDRFEGMSMADYPTGVRSGMGFPVVDNCVEEHIQ